MSDQKHDKPDQSEKVVDLSDKITHNGHYTVKRSRDGMHITRRIQR